MAAGWKRLVSLGALVVLAVGASASPARAKKTKPAGGGLFVSPLGVLFNSYHLELGLGLGRQTSLNFIGQYASVDVSENERASLFAGGLGLQLFPKGQLYDGFFFYPALLAGSGEVTQTGGSTSSISLVGPQLLLGYQWDWKPFSLRLGVGGYFFAASADSSGDESSLSGGGPLLDVTIGLTF